MRIILVENENQDELIAEDENLRGSITLYKGSISCVVRDMSSDMDEHALGFNSIEEIDNCITMLRACKQRWQKWKTE